MRTNATVVALLASLPLLMGAKGGCGALDSTEATTDVAGRWAVTYAPGIDVKVTLGGVAYSQHLPEGGGAFSVTHEGKPIAFTIDCARPDVVCPSEVWPTEVAIDQRDPKYPHRMWVAIPVQECAGKTVAPAAKDCGAGTLNPDCKPVCDGAVTTRTSDAFGLISTDGKSFDLLLGGGVASNGVNCVLLGLSTAHATLSPSGAAVEATKMSDGKVRTGFAGGCLWAGDPDMDGQVEALVLAASVELSTGFTAARVK